MDRRSIRWAFWGLLIGILFFNPILGAALGAASGALGGALSDYGINDKFMKDVSEVLQPGQAALFLMVRRHASDKVIDRLSQKGGKIIRTNLDATKEAALRAVFERAHHELTGGVRNLELANPSDLFGDVRSIKPCVACNTSLSLLTTRMLGILLN